MGVTGLWKLIDQAGKPVPLETLENKVLAIGKCYWLFFITTIQFEKESVSVQIQRPY